MQPPFTHTCPGWHASPPSAVVTHEGTQRPSTQAVLGAQFAVVVHGFALPLQTPRAMSHE
jgi:hypothetical protein